MRPCHSFNATVQCVHEGMSYSALPDRKPFYANHPGRSAHLLLYSIRLVLTEDEYAIHRQF